MARQNRFFGERELRQLGRAVRNVREKAALSQAQLAENAGLTVRPLRELEAGRSSPSLSTILAIAEALSVSLDDLIAAARARPALYGVLAAKDLTQRDHQLVAGIEQPRLRVRISNVRSGDDVSLPTGSIFAHVLGGAMSATLDGEQVSLAHGDSLHSRPGVLTEITARDGRAQVLLVEAIGGS